MERSRNDNANALSAAAAPRNPWLKSPGGTPTPAQRNAGTGAGWLGGGSAAGGSSVTGSVAGGSTGTAIRGTGAVRRRTW